jgi:hypothetical protein
MSAYRAGKGWCHGVTSLAFLDVGDCLPAPYPGTPIRRARGKLCSIPDQEKRRGELWRSPATRRERSRAGGDDGKKNILKIPPRTAEMIQMVRLLTR